MAMTVESTAPLEDGIVPMKEMVLTMAMKEWQNCMETGNLLLAIALL